VDEDDAVQPPHHHKQNKGKNRAVEDDPSLPRSPSEEEDDVSDPSSPTDNDRSSPHVSPPRTPSPQRRAPAPAPPGAPTTSRTRPQRTKRVPVKPGNVYGEGRHPVDILRDPQNKKGWRDVEESVKQPTKNTPPDAPVPGPSSQPPLPERETSLPDVSPTPSEKDVEAGLDPDYWGDLLSHIGPGGGVPNLSFLLAKAISPFANATTDPKTWVFRDIARLPKLEQGDWQKACLQELEALKERQVFELVQRPKGRKVIKNRWVFDVKSDGRKRARLVAKGFSQVEGIDYDQVFSPVVRFETVRLILAMAALHDWHITGLDVRNAFLYGKLDEEIYMEQPEGFHVPGRETEVLKLLRALYGLKQAGLAWWRTLRESMIELGFEGLVSDAGLFLYRSEHGFVIAVIYVDDSIFCGPNKALVQEIKQRFMQRWECRDLGDVTEFLRMRITREGRTVKIDQCAYLETVLQRCGMQDAKSAATPLPAGYMPEANAQDAVIDPELRSRYQTVIGSLLYLTLGTRPDIAFAVTKMAQFAASPNKEHLAKALYICRYLIGTKNYNITYDGSSGYGLIACTDSDWASDPANRRSQTGFFLKLAGGAISWTSRAQKTIALSSTEAEYMALSDCSRQVVWMHTLLGELGYNLRPIPICGDNQGSIFIASNPVTEKRSKHIDIRFHYIREVVERKLAEVFFIPGEENPADLLTKNLGSTKFLQFRPAYGLHFSK